MTSVDLTRATISEYSYKIWSFVLTNATIEEIEENGLYYVNGKWYKDFLIYTDDGEPFIAKVLMSVIEDLTEEGHYTVTPRYILTKESSAEVAGRYGNAMGYSDMTFEARQQLARDIVEYIIAGGLIEAATAAGVDTNLLDELGVTTFMGEDNRIVTDRFYADVLYDVLQAKYPNPTNPYNYNAISRENGTFILVDWNNKVIAPSMAGLIFDGEVTLSGFSASLAYDSINALLATDNSDVQDITASPIVRLAWRSVSPTQGSVLLSGFTPENNTIAISSDGASMSATIIKSKAAKFEYDLNTGIFNLTSVYNDDNKRVGCIFKNSVYNTTLDSHGRDGGSDAKTIYYNIMDSIGWNGELKPYTPTGTPTGPTWTVGNYTAISDDPIIGTTVTQQYYQLGIPNPSKPVKPSDDDIKTITPPPIDIKNPDPVPPPVVEGLQTTQGLYKVYKLNNAHLLMLGNWLWDENGVNLGKIQQIWKNDPMESVIGLHQLYFNPTATNTQSIKMGNVDTEISQDGSGEKVYTVDDRYQNLEFGFVTLDRYFKDVRDYQTKLTIYLPFIGFRELDPVECIGASLTLHYYVDVITGDCNAVITLNRKRKDGRFVGDEKCLYMFNGNCASPLPLTSSDKTQLYRNIANIGKGVVGGAVSGLKSGPVGALAGAGKNLIGGAFDMATQHNISIEKSGNIGGNIGAMSYKTPYLIIEKPLPADAAERGRFIGKPCNVSVKVGNVKGYAEFISVHLDTMGSITKEEKDMIDSLLKSGVIL